MKNVNNGIIKMKLATANRILKNKLFSDTMKKIEICEKDRPFCRHDLEHSLSVARLTVIMCMNNGFEADEDIIYSAALLHDIGRAQQYEKKTPHDVAGVEIADVILSQTECSEENKKKILFLINSHRNSENTDFLASLFYKADKKSRNCFNCSAQNECNWSYEKRNMILEG